MKSEWCTQTRMFLGYGKELSPSRLGVWNTPSNRIEVSSKMAEICNLIFWIENDPKSVVLSEKLPILPIAALHQCGHAAQFNLVGWGAGSPVPRRTKQRAEPPRVRADAQAALCGLSTARSPLLIPTCLWAEGPVAAPSPSVTIAVTMSSEGRGVPPPSPLYSVEGPTRPHYTVHSALHNALQSCSVVLFLLEHLALTVKKSKYDDFN